MNDLIDNFKTESYFYVIFKTVKNSFVNEEREYILSIHLLNHGKNEYQN